MTKCVNLCTHKYNKVCTTNICKIVYYEIWIHKKNKTKSNYIELK